MEEEETITIAMTTYNDLMDAYNTLCALEAGGVDNWQWYHQSLEDAGLLEEE